MNGSIKYVKKREKRHHEIYLVLLLLLCISVGFSYLTTKLDILGNTVIRKQSWDIHFENIVESSAIVPGTSRAVADRGDATITTDKTTEVKFNANLEYPGDYYEFTVVAKNAGTIDAMITDSEFSNTISPEYNFIDYTVTYAEATTDGDEVIAISDGLHNGKNILIKVRVEFNKDTITNEQLNAIEAEGIKLNSSFSIKFIQADIFPLLPRGKRREYVHLQDRKIYKKRKTSCI